MTQPTGSQLMQNSVYMYVLMSSYLFYCFSYVLRSLCLFARVHFVHNMSIDIVINILDINYYIT